MIIIDSLRYHLENKITLTKNCQCHWNFNFRAETGSVRNGWKFPVAKGLTSTCRTKSKKAHKIILT